MNVPYSIAVEQLVGLLSPFTTRISEFATEFEVEYVVLTAVDNGIHDRETIQERVGSTVRTLSDDETDVLENAIERLIEKQILIREDDATIQLQSTN